MVNIVEFIVSTCCEKKRKKNLLLPMGLELAKFCSSTKDKSVSSYPGAVVLDVVQDV